MGGRPRGGWALGGGGLGVGQARTVRHEFWSAWAVGTGRDQEDRVQDPQARREERGTLGSFVKAAVAAMHAASALVLKVAPAPALDRGARDVGSGSLAPVHGGWVGGGSDPQPAPKGGQGRRGPVVARFGGAGEVGQGASLSQVGGGQRPAVATTWGRTSVGVAGAAAFSPVATTHSLLDQVAKERW